MADDLDQCRQAPVRGKNVKLMTRELHMSVLVRNVQIACMAMFVSVAAGSSAARADNPLQAPGATQLMQLAQRDAAYCRNWAAQIQSMRNNYNSQCSGSLSPQQAARCNDMRQQLQNEIQRYNSQCG